MRISVIRIIRNTTGIKIVQTKKSNYKHKNEKRAGRQIDNMPNPDAILLKKFFDGWVVREWFNSYGGLHTVPQISVNEYKSYFTIYMREKLNYYCYHHGSVTGRDRMYNFIREHIEKWQIVHDVLCQREHTYDQVNALNDILELDILYIPGLPA